MSLAEPQTTDELLIYLCSREVPWHHFCVLGFGGGNHDTYALERGSLGYSIRYWERGQSSHVILENAEEAVACARYLELLGSMCLAVSILPCESAARELTQRLIAEGIDARLNPVHPGVFYGPMTQVLVPMLQLQMARGVALFPPSTPKPPPSKLQRLFNRYWQWMHGSDGR